MSARICIVAECQKSAHQRHPMCSMHRARVVRHGDPTVTIAPSDRKMKRGADNPRWNAAGSYAAVHQRLYRLHGPAKVHSCVDCGSVARHWSFDGARDDCNDSGVGPYSTDLSQYVPRCVPCHKRNDLAQLTTDGGEGR